MSISGGGGDSKRIADLLDRFRHASDASTVDRAARDQLLDELQDAVGLGGKMVTEADIVRRAERVIAGR